MSAEMAQELPKDDGPPWGIELTGRFAERTSGFRVADGVGFNPDIA